MLCELYAEIDRLRLLLQRLACLQFGRRSEQLTNELLQLVVEDLDQTVAENQAALQFDKGISSERLGGVDRCEWAESIGVSECATMKPVRLLLRT